MKEALAKSKEMESCECGSADCASCGGESCACGGEGCSGACYSACYGGQASGAMGHLKYLKLIVGVLLVASALWPAMISTQMAVGILGLWIIFKTALKLYYKC